MKTIRLSLLAAALLGTAAFLTAGPNYLPGRPSQNKPAPSQSYTNDRGPAHDVKAPAPATETGPATAPSCVSCACCKKAS